MKKFGKWTVAVIIALLCVMTIGVASASTIGSGKCGANVTWKLDSNHVLTISGTGPMGETPQSWRDEFYDLIWHVEIESGVTSISDLAFGNAMISTISIPTTVTSIGACAFGSNYTLQSITIPDSVTSIGWGAFQSCYGLTSVKLPSKLTRIEDDLFDSCTSLTSIKIPSSVTSIGEYAFYNSGLTSVTIPAGVKKIEEGVFFNAHNLTSVTLPQGLLTIGLEAFRYCDELTSITIPSSVTSIGESAFNGCYKLKSVTLLPGLRTIGADAFVNCDQLNNLTIPSSVTGISRNSFGYDYDYWSKTYSRRDGVTITGVSGTAAETYAKQNWIKFIGKTYDLDAPKLSSAKASGNNIAIKWGKVTGAAKYRVYYRTTSGWKKLVDTKKTSYTWKKAKSGVTYTFTVRCLDSKGHYISGFDKTGKSATIKVDAPKLSSVTNAATGITIKWGKVTGAENYRVYYKTTGSWKKLTDTTKTSYIWTKAKSGTKYTFTVKCMDKAGKKATSDYDTKGKSITYLAQPKLSSVSNTATGITMKWGKVTGAAKYRVYYKTTGSWKKLTDTTSTSYTWTKAKSGTKYSFTVQSLSSTGKTTSAYDATGKSITYLAQPKLSSVTQTTKGVTIKWGKVTGAAKYRVYYKTTDGWKKLTETKSTSYTWTKGKSGTKYTFTVCSLSSTGKTASTYDTKGKSITIR